MAADSDTTGNTPSLGRPRDPEVDQRIIAAMIAEFAEVGWSGLTMDRVARRAGVGKASLYLRWTSKETLLLHALDQTYLTLHDINTGNIRDDLISLADQVMTRYTSGVGVAVLRMQLEAAALPALAERVASLSNAEVMASRAIVRRAIRRGDLPPGTSVTLVMDVVVGSIMTHVLSTPEHLRARVAERSHDYTRDLVTFLLAGVATGAADKNQTIRSQ